MPRLAAGLRMGDDGVVRCFWAGDDPLYRRYHDEEWGFPVADDRRLFEKICLEGFQSGLSWLTILRKRESFRAAFCGFEFDARGALRRARRRAAAEGRRDRAAPRQDRVDDQQRPARARAARPSPARWRPSSGPSSRRRPTGRSGSPGRSCGRCRRPRRPSPSARRSRSGAGPSWARPRPTRSCRRWASSNDHVEGCAIRERVEAARARFKRPR